MSMQKLAKIMEMTTSTYDNEALSALRMANAFIAKEKTTWTKLLSIQSSNNSQSSSSSYREQTNQSYSKYQSDMTQEEIQAMFDYLETVKYKISEGQQSFVASLRDYFESKSYLTEKQAAALEKIYKAKGGQ